MTITKLPDATEPGSDHNNTTCMHVWYKTMKTQISLTHAKKSI